MFKTMNAIQFFQWGGNNSYFRIELLNGKGVADEFIINELYITATQRHTENTAEILVGEVFPSATEENVFLVKRSLLRNINEHLDKEFTGFTLRGNFEWAPMDFQHYEGNAGIFINNKNEYIADGYTPVTRSYFSFKDINHGFTAYKKIEVNIGVYKHNLPTLQEAKNTLTKLVIPTIIRVEVS